MARPGMCNGDGCASPFSTGPHGLAREMLYACLGTQTSVSSRHMNPDSFERHIKSGQVKPEMNFNQKVWALCARIPAGRVSTYGQIAKALGSPGAARAVGNALNKNPYAPAVPCHRVVGSNGSLTGFAGGLGMKERLLVGEGVALRNGRADVKSPYAF